MITFSYTKYFVHSYTIDLVLTLSYSTEFALSFQRHAVPHVQWRVYVEKPMVIETDALLALHVHFQDT